MNVQFRTPSGFAMRPSAATRVTPRHSFDMAVIAATRLSLILVGILSLSIILSEGAFVLQPVVFAIVVGLMLGPLADRFERAGMPPSLSAILVVGMFMALVAVILITIIVPLADWSRHLPVIWAKAKLVISGWKDWLQSASSMQEALKEAMGGKAAVTVSVDEGPAAADAVWLAPAIAGQILMFLASLYFYVATRRQIRIAVLSLCFERRLRWRVAHVFRDVEALVSRYLGAITLINFALGAAVAGVMALLGVPSPLLWGGMAAVLNYVIYAGPAVMAVILAGVGLATGATASEWLAPPLAYLALNAIEAQFVTPHVLGRTMTLNPFLVFLALAFWLWIWGPVGGFVAVPVVLVVIAILRHVIPANHRRHVRTANETAAA